MRSRNLYIFFIVGAIFLCRCDHRPNRGSSDTDDLPKSTSLQENETGKEKSIREIQLSGLDGEPISLESFSGKTVFLNFWATWCKPCLEEMPSIENARKQLATGDFVFLAASDENPDKIKKFKSRHDYTFRLVHLRSNFPDLDIYSLPTTLIINGDGEIVMEKAGALQWDSPQMIKQLKQIADSSK